MTVEFVGTHTKPIRILTGCYTLDRAFINKDGDIGMPVGIGYELFGMNHVGKSTLAYSIASIMGREVGGDIALCDFEGFDDAFIKQVAETVGFSGKVFSISEEQDEDQLDQLINLLGKKCNVGILDSIGAIAPMGEIKGDIGESNMGKRAFLIAQFSRKGLKLFRFNKNKTILMINHWYPKLGGYGYDTPGGEAKKYLASVRIKLQRKDEFPDGSYALLGTVVKNRWGYKDRTFNVFILAGYGLHIGMTALWDCIVLKLVKRTKSGLMAEGENLGKLGLFARDAKEGKIENFQPFFTLLERYNANKTESDPSEGTDTSESDELGEEDQVVGD